MAQSAVRLPPKKVAPGTYLIQEVQHALGQPLSVYINSAVILGSDVEPVLEACPEATLVCSWALVERFANAYEFPLSRCRWVNHGDAFTAGDRTLVALRPPVYDSPTTRGLLDTTTGVYWAADAFATPVPGGPGSLPPDHVNELDPEL